MATPTAYGTTRVSAGGDVVTITVPIDVQLVGHDPVTDSDRAYFDQLRKLTDKFWWGDDLRELRYRDCLKFELVLDINLLPDSPEAVPRDGAHQIEWWLDDPNVRSTVIDPGTSDPTADAPTAFRDSLTGQWGYMNIRDFNHELGHLLGLGDDYTGYPDSTPLAGRDGTMMDGGSTVDQALMDRIGKMIEEAGIELPECNEVWTGTARTVLDSPTCSGIAEASFELAVTVDGSVSGDGRTAWKRLTGDCSGFAPAKLRVSGTREDDAFELVFTVLGPYGFEVPPITVPIRGNMARATVRRAYQTESYELECESCPPGGG